MISSSFSLSINLLLCYCLLVIAMLCNIGTHNFRDLAHRLADDIHSLMIICILQWSIRGLLHGVAAGLPESSVWMTHPVVGHAGLTAVGRFESDAVLPHRPHDVEDENDSQDEEHDSKHRANDDCHPRSSVCGEE